MNFCETGFFCEKQDDFAIVVSKYNFCALRDKETGNIEHLSPGGLPDENSGRTVYLLAL